MSRSKEATFASLKASWDKVKNGSGNVKITETDGAAVAHAGFKAAITAKIGLLMSKSKGRDMVTSLFALVPLRLRGHYGDQPPGPARHGAANVICRIGYGATPIDATARARGSIGTLMAWQQLDSSAVATVHFP